MNRSGKNERQLEATKDAVLAELVRRLDLAYRPERVYLFGSRARGDEGPDSDYDILLVVPDDAPPELKRARLAYQVLCGTGVASRYRRVDATGGRVMARSVRKSRVKESPSQS